MLRLIHSNGKTVKRSARQPDVLRRAAADLKALHAIDPASAKDRADSIADYLNLARCLADWERARQQLDSIVTREGA